MRFTKLPRSCAFSASSRSSNLWLLALCPLSPVVSEFHTDSSRRLKVFSFEPPIGAQARSRASCTLFAACRDYFCNDWRAVPLGWTLGLSTHREARSYWQTCLSRYTPIARGPLCVHHSLEGEHVHALRSRDAVAFLSCRTLWAEKIQSTTDAGSLNTFGRNEIEVAPISSEFLRIACLVILYKTLPCSGPRTRSRWGIRTGMGTRARLLNWALSYR